MLRKLFLPLFALFASAARGQTPAPPAGLNASGYDSHVELRWQANAEPNLSNYQVFRSEDGADFSLLKTLPASAAALVDWTGDEGPGVTRFYKIKAVAGGADVSDFSDPVSATTAPMTDEALLDMAQRYTFRYFWDYAHPASGMARERNNGDDDIVTSGGSGFGIMAIIVGAERGWVTREAAVDRMLTILTFLQLADKFHGVFPHWMDGNDGDVVPFSQYDNGADLVETAFLMQGLLAARQYFNQDNPLENAVRSIITGLWEDVEWDWFRKNGGPVLYWHWSPNYGWQMNFPLRGFHEAQIVYILAAASPTHPVPGSLYQTGWTSGNYANAASHYGLPIYCGPYGGGPMFFAHYSYLGFDPRGKKDAFCNYFVRNRNHALIQNAYAIANPEGHDGYSAECWGLTSSDQQNGYAAHDIWPPNDNGTIAPTAALASIPYTPAESMDALRHFYREHGEKLWGLYGFYDAFNLDQNWFATSYLAIDQGPIVAMIENRRTGLLWDLFMANPEIQPALDAIGFVPDASGTDEWAPAQNGFSARVFPNPAINGEQIAIEIAVARPQSLTAVLYAADGRRVRELFSARAFAAGVFSEKTAVEDLPAGVYFLSIENDQKAIVFNKIILLKKIE